MRVMEDFSPDFDSGWISLGAGRGVGASTYLEVPHSLGAMPGYVRVCLHPACGQDTHLNHPRLATFLALQQSPCVCIGASLVSTPHNPPPPHRRCHRRVKVLTRVVTGPSGGWVFPALGAAMTDDDLAAVESYGGVVFGYSDTTVRLWLPDAATGAINTAGCSVRGRPAITFARYGGDRCRAALCGSGIQPTSSSLLELPNVRNHCYLRGGACRPTSSPP